MKVPFSWLADYVELKQSASATAEILTAAGLKVEKIEHLGEGLDGVVAGEVLNVEPHPNADKLVLVDVSTGERKLRVVCGARNFSVGDKVPVAAPGSRVPALGVLEARKIRGAVSEGMLCSAMELGVGEDHSGILVLNRSVSPGSDVREILGLDETVLQLEITPNRPDAMSLMGIAREVAACTGADLKQVTPAAPEGGVPVEGLVKVVVEDRRGCPRYVARVVQGVSVAPSPEFVQRRLTLAGIRPISNVVDSTNYALIVTGHPMHAFDLDLLEQATIVARRAESGESLVGIDGEERKLDSDDLVIADSSRPVALAGVMGGRDTEVTNSTTRVALESAYFEPASVFRSSRRHGLRTEASARFERGADPNNAGFAAQFAISCLLSWAGGDLASGKVDVYPHPVEPRSISVRTARANLALGTHLTPDEMNSTLDRLGLDPELSPDGGLIRVAAPTRRHDLVAEEDLIEEIARVSGYDRIPATLPLRRPAGSLPRDLAVIRRLKTALTGAGLYEGRSSILIAESELQMLRLDRPAVKVANPLTQDESVLRPSLLPGLVASVGRNFARRNLDVRLFEVGSTFVSGDPGGEELRLGLAMGGQVTQQWHSAARPIDFYDLKGVVEAMMAALVIGDFALEEGAGPALHPTRSARVVAAGRPLGTMGQMAENYAEAVGAAYPVLLAEFDLAALVQLAGTPEPAPIQAYRFPAVLLDLSVSVPEEARAGGVLQTAREVAGESLDSIRLIDVYRGQQAGEGRKSLAFSLSFRSPERTLTEAEALQARDAIVAAIEKRHGGKVRG